MSPFELDEDERLELMKPLDHGRKRKWAKAAVVAEFLLIVGAVFVIIFAAINSGGGAR